MPAFGDALSAEQVRAFVRYLRGFCKETGWPTGNLNLPRPILTEKAFPENEFVIAPVASHDPNRFAEFAIKATYERRIGRRAEFEVFVPFESIKRGPRLTGVGDVGVGLKYVLTPRASRYLDYELARSSPSAPAASRGSRARTAPCSSRTVLAATTAGRAHVQGRFALGLPFGGSWQTREIGVRCVSRHRHQRRARYLDVRH